jgi:hypothetical protein
MQVASVYPQDLPDRAALVSLMDGFVTFHRSCGFEELSRFSPVVPGCLGPTAIWATTSDSFHEAGVIVWVRQLKGPRNEYVVEAHHTPSGWAIISVGLVDAS